MNETAIAPKSAREWATLLTDYQGSSNGRAFVELGVTLFSYLALVFLMLAGVHSGNWITLLAMLPASAFLLRLFMIQHDCGHQSLFESRWLNNCIGRLLGVLTLTPFDYWSHNHAIHHVSSGNLDRRGVGDIDTLTVEEFLALTRKQQFLYRVYRNPIVLFLIGPAYMFLIQQRLPARMITKGWLPWISTMGTNLGILAVSAGIVWLTSWSSFLIVLLPTTLIAATAGVWLFFVQHQFEETIWEQSPEWNRHEAALYGSSYYELPMILRWFTGNIGVHHVHHLNSKIPFFRLSQVLRDYPALSQINKITLRESLNLINLSLWDSRKRRLVSFSEALAPQN